MWNMESPPICLICGGELNVACSGSKCKYSGSHHTVHACTHTHTHTHTHAPIHTHGIQL